jgi:thioredoxin-like negative regulator of GroEL
MRAFPDIHEETVDEFNLQGLPMFGLFVDGEMVATHSGALKAEKLKDFIDQNIAKHVSV